jgi:hypothetical protein
MATTHLLGTNATIVTLSYYIKIQFEKDLNNDNIRHITFEAYNDRLKQVLQNL